MLIIGYLNNVPLGLPEMIKMSAYRLIENLLAYRVVRGKEAGVNPPSKRRIVDLINP